MWCFFQTASPVVFVHTDAFSSGNKFLHFNNPIILSSDLEKQHNMEFVAIFLYLKTEMQLSYLLFRSIKQF